MSMRHGKHERSIVATLKLGVIMYRLHHMATHDQLPEFRHDLELRRWLEQFSRGDANRYLAELMVALRPQERTRIRVSADGQDVTIERDWSDKSSPHSTVLTVMDKCSVSDTHVGFVCGSLVTQRLLYHSLITAGDKLRYIGNKLRQREKLCELSADLLECIS